MRFARRLALTVGALFAALVVALAAPTPATASPVNPGGLCAVNEVGQTRLADNGHYYTCTVTSEHTRNWKRCVTACVPSTTASCGYGCPTKPPATTPPATTTATPTSTPSSPATTTPPATGPATPGPTETPVGGSLPVTGPNGTVFTVTLIIGAALVAGGIALIVTTNRRRRYRRGQMVA